MFRVEHGGFEALIIHYPVRYNHDGDDAATGSAFVTTPAPTAKTCGDDTDAPSNLEWRQQSVGLA